MFVLDGAVALVAALAATARFPAGAFTAAGSEPAGCAALPGTGERSDGVPAPLVVPTGIDAAALVPLGRFDPAAAGAVPMAALLGVAAFAEAALAGAFFVAPARAALAAAGAFAVSAVLRPRPGDAPCAADDAGAAAGADAAAFAAFDDLDDLDAGTFAG
jgi:hypothetical protein